MRTTRRLTVAIAASAVAIAACSPAGDDESAADAAGRTTVTFRLWDEQVARAYEESFAEFEQQQDDIRVEVELIPWADYWTKLPQDVGSGDMADIFWTNSASFTTYADNDNLLDITDLLGDQVGEWKQSVVDQYTWDGALWGVPQLWDSIALYYNVELLEEAGVDPTDLRWDPTGDDTLLRAAQALTLDADGRTADDPDFDPDTIDQFGFNSAWDLQSIVEPFVGSNGGQWDTGGQYVLDSAETTAAVQYAVDLINQHQVSPSAADTNTDGERTRDLFIQGRLALYQSGPWRLKDIQEGAEFDWDIAPMVEGPAGRVSAVNGIIAAGYAQTENPDETVEVLRWLGTPEGQQPIAEGGFAFPGVPDAEPAFLDYWADQDIDVTPFLAAAEGDVIYPPWGDRAQAGMEAVDAIMQDVFLGRMPVNEGLTEAQQTGNEAMADS